MSRLLVIGLDCLPPELVFEKFDLPNLRSLMREGVHGPLRSTVPPITVPAWVSMTTGKDPGELGLYGFRNRKDRGYGWSIATSRDVAHETVWDVSGRNGKNSVVCGVPLTYPPKPVRGCLISDFMTPSTASEFTHPPSLKDEVLKLEPGYVFDVKGFRSEGRENLLQQIHGMTAQHFRVAGHLLKTRPWDFFMMVEIGPDRLHHVFWKYQDPRHKKYQPGGVFESALKDYYTYLDQKTGELIAEAGKDVSVLVVSDHGAQRMDGGFAINEWLIREGYLVLKEKPGKVLPLEEAKVDWGKTKMWGAGGYYARLFANVRGREPEGTVAPGDLEKLLKEVSGKLIAMKGAEGKIMNNTIYRPSEIYKSAAGSPPDLIAYLSGLLWRSVGSVGHGALFVDENDTGADDANHSEDGIFILREPRGLWGRPGERVDGKNIADVFPLMCQIMEIQ